MIESLAPQSKAIDCRNLASQVRTAVHRAASVATDISKYTGQSVRPADYSLNDLESNRLAGIFRVIWSNLCTRHIPDKLKPRGHHDWPDNILYRLIRRDGSTRHVAAQSGSFNVASAIGICDPADVQPFST